MNQSKKARVVAEETKTSSITYIPIDGVTISKFKCTDHGDFIVLAVEGKTKADEARLLQLSRDGVNGITDFTNWSTPFIYYIENGSYWGFARFYSDGTIYQAPTTSSTSANFKINLVIAKSVSD